MMTWNGWKNEENVPDTCLECGYCRAQEVQVGSKESGGPENIYACDYPEKKCPFNKDGFDMRGTTCMTCKDTDECPYAGDPYNTDGDCLAIK
jgi:hypothetical protein